MSTGSMTPNDFWMSALSTRVLPEEEISRLVDGDALSRKILEDEANGIARVLQAVRSRHNRSSAISRLPLEVLANIFWFAKKNEPPYRILDNLDIGRRVHRLRRIHEILHESGSTLPFRLGWICVTHVCQQWREAALRHPRLWTDIDFARLSSSWVEEMILRSKMAPISVNIETYQITEAKTILQMVNLIAEPSVMSRTQVLKLRDFSQWGKFREPLSLLRRPAPIMEELSLDFGALCHGVDLPTDLLASAAPRLAILRVGGLQNIHDSPLLANLEQLELVLTLSVQQGSGILVANMPTPPQLTTLFDRTPKLRVLFLDNAYPNQVPLLDNQSHAYTINIPSRIQHLILHGQFNSCANFACNLVVPLTTSMSFVLMHPNIGNSPMLPALLSHYGGPLRPPREIFFGVKTAAVALIIMVLYPEPPSSTSMLGQPFINMGPKIHIELGMDAAIGNTHLPCSSVFSALYLNEVSKITLLCDRTDAPPGPIALPMSIRDMWGARNTTLLCWNLHLYVASGAYTEPLQQIEELMPTRDLNPGSPLGDRQPEMTLANVPFPMLEGLYIMERPTTGALDPEHDAAFVGAVVECLRQRWKAGSRLKTLEFPLRFIGDERINRLQEETNLTIEWKTYSRGKAA